MPCEAEPRAIMPRRIFGLNLAVDRARRSKTAVYALIADAKDERAAAFYQHHNVLALPCASRTLLLLLLRR